MERSERMSLAEQLRQRPSRIEPAPVPPAQDDSADRFFGSARSAHSLFSSHKILERGLEAWPKHYPAEADAPQENRSVLHAGQRDVLLDP